MLTIVIPTLQKSISTLELLLKTLDNDPVVGEIIVIDNSLRGLNINSTKLRVITPKENLYVNPSWNLGVKEAKYDKIGLLNDDIAIPENFCSKIIEHIKEDVGIIGIERDSVTPVAEIITLPEFNSLQLAPVKERTFSFGIAMFFHKNSYYEIPEEIKIFYGDDWIFVKNQKNKKENFVITNCELYHLGSLSSSNKSFSPIFTSDRKIYLNMIRSWYEYIFFFSKDEKHYKISILGLTFNIRRFFFR